MTTPLPITPSSEREPTFQLDELDRTILRLLQLDSSLSATEIARRVDLSPPGLKKRLRKLEEAGVIVGQVALLRREAVEFDLLCFVQVTLAHHQPDAVSGCSQGGL